MFKKESQKKLGLALGSGAARGLAHIGVLKALQHENIPIDCIAGSSIGALTGAYFARHLDISGMEALALHMDFPNLLKLADPNLLLLAHGLVSGKKVEELLKLLIGDIDFKDLKIPLIIVTTDIRTGKEVVVTSGSVIKAIRASISIPGIFTPIKLNGSFLIDGGITNPLPVNILKDAGVKRIIASNVVNTPGSQKQKKQLEKKEQTQKEPFLEKINTEIKKLADHDNPLLKKAKQFIAAVKDSDGWRSIQEYADTPSIYEAVINAIYTMEYKIAQAQVEQADVVITPPVSQIQALEFYRVQEAITAGYAETKAVLAKEY